MKCQTTRLKSEKNDNMCLFVVFFQRLKRNRKSSNAKSRLVSLSYTSIWSTKDKYEHIRAKKEGGKRKETQQTHGNENVFLNNKV